MRSGKYEHRSGGERRRVVMKVGTASGSSIHILSRSYEERNNESCVRNGYMVSRSRF